MVPPLVSIVIPTFNRSWGLRRALESALAQSQPSFEVMVVDDCSTDDTEDVVRSFRHPAIVYRRQPRRVGMVGNWGTGLELASGEFLVFLADDDRFGPRCLEDHLRAYANRGEMVASFSRYEVRDPEGRLLGVGGHRFEHETVLAGVELFRAALSREWFLGATLYRTEALRRIWRCVTDDDLVLDIGLNLRLALSGSTASAIPESHFELCEHPGQNSNARRSEVFEQTERLLRGLLAEGIPGLYARLVRRELAAWHTVWGRRLAEDGAMDAARAHFAQAVRVSPTSTWPWRQLVASFIAPDRVRDARAKQTRALR
jgi:hypothetical protein